LSCRSLIKVGCRMSWSRLSIVLWIYYFRGFFIERIGETVWDGIAGLEVIERLGLIVWVVWTIERETWEEQGL